MPKSKRNKQVELSKAKKRGLDLKKDLYEKIRSCVDSYAHVFVFSVNDMRNNKMKKVRENWKHSRFFIGKNKVMAMALGTCLEKEYRPNLHKIGQKLKGERGLLFSNQSPEEVLSWFGSYSEGDYARSGNTATEDVSLSAGPLPQFPHSLEPHLRLLGLPTTLNKGVIHLIKDHEVCRVGDILKPETAKILELLGYEMAEFRIKIECVWSQDGSFENFLSESCNGDLKENLDEKSTFLNAKRHQMYSKRNALCPDPDAMDVIDSTECNLEVETSSENIKETNGNGEILKFGLRCEQVQSSGENNSGPDSLKPELSMYQISNGKEEEEIETEEISMEEPFRGKLSESPEDVPSEENKPCIESEEISVKEPFIGQLSESPEDVPSEENKPCMESEEISVKEPFIGQLSESPEDVPSEENKQCVGIKSDIEEHAEEDKEQITKVPKKGVHSNVSMSKLIIEDKEKSPFVSDKVRKISPKITRSMARKKKVQEKSSLAAEITVTSENEPQSERKSRAVKRKIIVEESPVQKQLRNRSVKGNKK